MNKYLIALFTLYTYVNEIKEVEASNEIEAMILRVCSECETEDEKESIRNFLISCNSIEELTTKLFNADLVISNPIKKL